MKSKLYVCLLVLLVGVMAMSCSDNLSDGPTIFPEGSPDRDQLDSWLQRNYTGPYNIDFKYKMEDIEADHRYTLVPADSAKSAKLAMIVKYLWLDAYSEVMGQNFVKSNVPRIIHLVGSAAYNSNGTMVLGTAEGGLKVTLYMVNDLTDDMLSSYDTMTTYYFHTMHHEFTHILNQKKPYDTDYNQITESGYVSGDWYLVSTAVARAQGFVTPYALSEGLEDFAEMLSCYITYTPEQWDEVMQGGIVYGTDGKGNIVVKDRSGFEALTKKLEMVRNYMKSSWNVDIDDLREVILRRGAELKTLDLEHLK